MSRRRDLFDRFAENLFSKILIVCNGVQFRLTEIEFYLYSDDHPDPFVHRHPRQLTNGEWYFHCTTHKEGTYKGGTFKGLDITFGIEETKPEYGGILIRSIQNLDTSEYIVGPCNCVDALLTTAGYPNDIRGLVGAMPSLSILDQRNILRVERVELAPPEIRRSPRVGLSMKRATPATSLECLQWLVMPYRYLTNVATGTKMIRVIEMTEALTRGAIKPSKEIPDVSGLAGKEISETQILQFVYLAFI